MSDGTGCMCCSARTCLIVWSSLGVLGSILNMISMVVTGSFDFDDGSTVTSFSGATLNIVINIYVVFAAATKSRQMLKLAFWLTIFNMVCTVTIMIVTILFVEHVIGFKYYCTDDETGLLVAVIITFLIVLAVQVCLAWVIRKTVKEITIEKDGHTTTATYAYTRRY